MNAKTVPIALLLIVVLMGTLAIAVKPARAASEIMVPDDYLKIQDAVAAANSGDTIVVKAGTYYEEWVSVDKQVSLVGDNQKSVVYYSTAVGFIVTANSAHISGFTITSSEAMQGYAIGISNSTGCVVEDNLIENNLVGISISGSSSGNTVSENTLKHNERSIELFDSLGNTVSDNNITGAVVSGISLDSSSGNTVTGNRISDLEDGLGALMLWKSSNNVVSRNLLFGGNPMLLLGSSDNSLSENFVIESEYGIVVGLSSNNKIFSNYFINVTEQVMDTDISEGAPSENSWDDGATGNYWSDYDGVDGNGDGIGDSPYVLYENNQDNYPLMEPAEISEFPTWSILPLFLAATFVGVIAKKKH